MQLYKFTETHCRGNNKHFATFQTLRAEVMNIIKKVLINHLLLSRPQHVLRTSIDVMHASLVPRPSSSKVSSPAVPPGGRGTAGDKTIRTRSQALTS